MCGLPAFLASSDQASLYTSSPFTEAFCFSGKPLPHHHLLAHRLKLGPVPVVLSLPFRVVIGDRRHLARRLGHALHGPREGVVSDFSETPL